MNTPTIDTDLERATITVTTFFEAPPEAVWQLWSDPRKLEQWWGPPTHPGTVVEHDLVPGGRVAYYMTGPEGERYHGLWNVQSVNAPTEFQVEDAFADSDGNVDPDLPGSVMQVKIEGVDNGTRMTVRSTYGSTEAMEQVLAMGVLEGLQASMAQIEAVLAVIVAA